MKVTFQAKPMYISKRASTTNEKNYLINKRSQCLIGERTYQVKVCRPTQKYTSTTVPAFFLLNGANNFIKILFYFKKLLKSKRKVLSATLRRELITVAFVVT